MVGRPKGSVNKSTLARLAAQEAAEAAATAAGQASPLASQEEPSPSPQHTPGHGPVATHHPLFWHTPISIFKQGRQAIAARSWASRRGRASTSTSSSSAKARRQKHAVPDAGDVLLFRAGRRQLGAVKHPALMLPPLQELMPGSPTGLWPSDLQLPAALYTVLGHLGRCLEPAAKLMPSSKEMEWEQAVQSAMQAHALDHDTVHHALLLQYPLHNQPNTPALCNGSYCSTLQLRGQPQPCQQQQQPQVDPGQASTSSYTPLDMLADVAAGQQQQARARPKGLGMKPNGYASVHVGKHAIRKKPMLVYAHRLVLYACVGLPKHVHGLDPSTQYEELMSSMSKCIAMHHCDNKLCVNFKHLYWGNASLNGKGTHATYEQMRHAAMHDQTRRFEDEVQQP